MCTPYNIHQKWSFDCFWLRANSWNNEYICCNINFQVEEYTYFCLFVWGFSSHSRIFQSFGNVCIAGEGLQTVTRVIRLKWSSLRTRDSHKRLAVELSRPVFTTSRLGLEHPTFRLRGEHSSPLRHCGGYAYFDYFTTALDMCWTE